jgi:AcrR family transcriptional regulator
MPEAPVPTPSRTSLDAIVGAGRAILDAEGVDALTMQRVAAAVGVRAPSLYKRVRDRDALVRLIAADVTQDLGRTLSAASTTGDPRADLGRIAMDFRAWAKRHPGGFGLLFAPLPDAWRLEPSAGGAALDALFGVVAELAGPDHVLEAARTVVAWSSGFVAMELAGAFRLGGDVDEAFAYGVERMATAIALPSEPSFQQATFREHV